MELLRQRTHSEPHLGGGGGGGVMPSKRKKEVHFPESTFESRKASKAETLFVLDNSSSSAISQPAIVIQENMPPPPIPKKPQVVLKVAAEKPPTTPKLLNEVKYAKIHKKKATLKTSRTPAQLSIDLGKTACSSAQCTPKASNAKSLKRLNSSVGKGEKKLSMNSLKKLGSRRLTDKKSPQCSIPDSESQELPIKRLPEFTVVSNRGALFNSDWDEERTGDDLMDSSPIICENASKQLLTGEEQFEAASIRRHQSDKIVTSYIPPNVLKGISKPREQSPKLKNDIAKKQYFSLNMKPQLKLQLQDTPTKDSSSLFFEDSAGLRHPPPIKSYRFNLNQGLQKTHLIHEISEEDARLAPNTSEQMEATTTLPSSRHRRETSITAFYRESGANNLLSFDKITAEHALTPDLSHRCGTSLGPKLSLH